jgi:hypothetical protein
MKILFARMTSAGSIRPSLIGATRRVGAGCNGQRYVCETTCTRAWPPSALGAREALIVGAAGFEPAASRTQAGCATRLRYAPLSGESNHVSCRQSIHACSRARNSVSHARTVRTPYRDLQVRFRS